MMLADTTCEKWVSLPGFDEFAGGAGRDSGFSDFNAIRTSIIPVVMTMTLARNVEIPHVVRFVGFVRRLDHHSPLPKTKQRSCTR
ncbi:hypothetical protein [Mariniblastus fucicola]|uniref:Uncharacterized protein n=1 Tax=Mariniblastus fucicola TaxID=980251 RepID=A0A5B9P211_9BACT|nr:hypothetical protein [Mariniblastus fucicola]QEG20547.1 hypothetical protein MFFC18_03960 [Mariniblastus fucicola]